MVLPKSSSTSSSSGLTITRAVAPPQNEDGLEMMLETDHPEFTLGTNKNNCNKNKEGIANITSNDQLSDSTSENLEDIDYDDEIDTINGDGVTRPTKKRYHRHTTHQIQEMERVFKECPHPDEKQRQELSRELKLSPRQIKFWFQNKRTQMKAHHERKDNGVLRTENEKLKAENCALRDAVRNVSCPTCGGPASVAEMSLEEQQLRIENARLKEEIDRITNMVTKHIGRKNVNNDGGGGASTRGVPVTNNSMMAGGSRASRGGGGRGLITSEGEGGGGGEMMMNMMMRMMRGGGNNGGSAAIMYGGGGGGGGADQEEIMKHGGENINKNMEEEGEEEGEVEELGPTVAEIASRPLGLTEGEKPLVVELAVASMEELIEMARSQGPPLWVVPTTTNAQHQHQHQHHHQQHHQTTTTATTYSNADADCSGESCLDLQAYFRRFPRGIGPTPLGLSSECTRHSGLVIMNSASLVEIFMDVAQWKEMFSSIISRARIVEVLSMGVAGTYDGAIQLMYAEFQIPTPLVPTRENYFLRYSKHVDHFWVVVDVSIDSLRGNPPPSLLRCRRRPSGCIIEEMPNGYSKVTWVENVEVDTKGVHNLYQSFVDSGMAFGAVRWLSALQRQCERIASVLANNVPSGDSTVVPNVEGRRSMLKLAERMVKSFNGGVGSSTSEAWVTLAGNNCSGAEDVRVVIHKSNDEPGHPPGIVLSASTSLWLPTSPRQIFQFLRTDRLRSEWDILSNNGVIKEMFYIAKGPDPGNSVSLLRVNPINSNQSNMLILQECCTDEVCSLVVYAPIDVAAMSGILNGGDPDSVALLPSGFAILPDGPLHPHRPSSSSPPAGGSLLTLAFQILVDHVPTARLSLGSVATVNKLISNTVARIKSSLSLSYD